MINYCNKLQTHKYKENKNQKQNSFAVSIGTLIIMLQKHKENTKSR